MFSETEILEARRLIFDFFPVADNKGLDMGAKERRHHLRGHCEDLVNKVIEVCNRDHDVVFCMPWDATFHDFISEDERLAREVIIQRDSEIDAKFADLEKRIDEKNKATIEAVKGMCDKVIKTSSEKSSSAPVHGQPGPVGSVATVGVPAPVLGQYARVVEGAAGFPALPNVDRVRATTFRERSSSASKRRRTGDHPDEHAGEDHHASAGHSQQQNSGTSPDPPGWTPAGSRRGHRAQKFVLGTGNRNTAGAVRRMKTSRADVFVYAVDPDTTVDDIVADLAYSEIEVAASHVVKKTREGSTGLDCYRISVKREDLVKALHPDTWPAGVRVREWVHYPARRPQGQEGAGQGQHAAGDRANGVRGQAAQ